MNLVNPVKRLNHLHSDRLNFSAIAINKIFFHAIPNVSDVGKFERGLYKCISLDGAIGLSGRTLLRVEGSELIVGREGGSVHGGGITG